MNRQALTMPHARVTVELATLSDCVAYGKADPELLRMEYKDLAARSHGGFSAARFEPEAVPPVAAAPYAGVIENPLAPPVITGTTYSIDLALQNPTRVITPQVLDLTRLKFFVDKMYANAGGVTGGAVIYDIVAGGDQFADRDVARVGPGDEFPLVTFSRRAPAAAEVEKWGAKFFFPDEARDRNNLSEWTRAMRQLANTVVRKINQRGVEILEAFISANARTVTGNNWSNVNTTYSAGSNYTLFPQRDFARADLIASQEEMEMAYRLWIINPLQLFELEGIYGDKLGALLSSLNVDIYVTNRVADGVAYAVAPNQVGEMRIEKPLGTVTWRVEGREGTWVQSSVRPLMFANNPFAILKFVGLHG